MCGVMAVVGRDHESLCRKGLGSMQHRGIRSRIESVTGGSIGHVRLPIIGLGEESDQPRWLREDRVLLGFVGEILDFRETHPGALSDTDAVVQLVSDHGMAGLKGRDGFWSVVTLETGKVEAVVDYLAQKPLYYRDGNGWFAVASEPDALACLAPCRLDRRYLAAVAKWGYCPEERRTPWQTISRMSPGEHLRAGPGGLFSLRTIDRIYPKEGDLKRLVDEAVQRRVLSSDVPVACLLSGGLDSSIVYTLARKYSDVKAYHVENGELGEAREICDDLTVKFGEGLPSVPKCLYYMQEPVDLGSLQPQVDLSDTLGGQGEIVCLTGDGADEMFGGYSRSMRYDSQASDVWHELVNWHLPRLDRVMMKNRVEVRSPFLARRVAEAALALPWSLRRNKLALRETFRDILPPGVADRIKRPLRTKVVEQDREARSLKLIDTFIHKTHREFVDA